MAISEKLLEILVCPKCKGALQYVSENPSLDCLHCRLSYPVKEDIPVMLIDEAKGL
ncbi:MAG: Trm112 family protein [Geobacteraceae bacterium]|nr:Trm112 family protein [Geobacteraceae bacterium]